MRTVIAPPHGEGLGKVAPVARGHGRCSAIIARMNRAIAILSASLLWLLPCAAAAEPAPAVRDDALPTALVAALW